VGGPCFLASASRQSSLTRPPRRDQGEDLHGVGHGWGIDAPKFVVRWCLVRFGISSELVIVGGIIADYYFTINCKILFYNQLQNSFSPYIFDSFISTWTCSPFTPRIFMIPFHLVLTLPSIFSCFCMFLTFRDLPDVKRTKSFCHVIFQKIEDCQKKKSMGNAARRKRGALHGPTFGPRGGAHLPPHASKQC
jgi:hypothetical protein